MNETSPWAASISALTGCQFVAPLAINSPAQDRPFDIGGQVYRCLMAKYDTFFPGGAPIDRAVMRPICATRAVRHALVWTGTKPAAAAEEKQEEAASTIFIGRYTAA